MVESIIEDIEAENRGDYSSSSNEHNTYNQDFKEYLNQDLESDINENHQHEANNKSYGSSISQTVERQQEGHINQQQLVPKSLNMSPDKTLEQTANRQLDGSALNTQIMDQSLDTLQEKIQKKQKHLILLKSLNDTIDKSQDSSLSQFDPNNLQSRDLKAQQNDSKIIMPNIFEDEEDLN